MRPHEHEACAYIFTHRGGRAAHEQILRHRVEVTFEPRWLQIGALIAAATLVGVAALVLAAVFTRSTAKR
jgi:hypothetical protein